MKLLFRKDKEFCLLLYRMLGFMPNNLHLYRKALTHSSLITGHKHKLSNNERLEFLGDAVLSAVTSDYLYLNYSREREGFLSKSRSRLVCRENLNALAFEIGLEKLVHIGDIAHNHNNYIYGNAFEALIGAVYLDKGYETCRRFILERVFSCLPDMESVICQDKNYKSRLIEWSQKERRVVTFSLLSEERRTDGCYFVSEVLVDGEVAGLGEGFSKRESEQQAAMQALEQLNENVFETVPKVATA